jgi:Rrf2 family protein
MISTTAEYALRAVLLLAMRDNNQALRANEIADAIGAPRNYLSKTLRVLAHLGVIEGTRGPHGGFRIAADPQTITIAMLVDLFDEARSSNGCLVVGCDCTASAPCAVYRWWSEVEDAGRMTLESTSIAHLVRTRSRWVATARKTAVSRKALESAPGTSARIPAKAAAR